MTKELTKMRGILITVLVEWMILRICVLTPSCSPNPRALSEAQPTEKKCRKLVLEEVREVRSSVFGQNHMFGHVRSSVLMILKNIRPIFY